MEDNNIEFGDVLTYFYHDIWMYFYDVIASFLALTFLYTNWGILIWAADSKWSIFDLPIINNFQNVLDQWLNTLLLIEFIQIPVDFIRKVLIAFHDSPNHNPENDGFKFLI